jgi:hypothetical protein
VSDTADQPDELPDTHHEQPEQWADPLCGRCARAMDDHDWRDPPHFGTFLDEPQCRNQKYHALCCYNTNV